MATGRYRRVSPIASGRGDGLLSDHRAGAQLGRQELVFMPRSGLPDHLAKTPLGDRGVACVIACCSPPCRNLTPAIPSTASAIRYRRAKIV